MIGEKVADVARDVCLSQVIVGGFNSRDRNQQLYNLKVFKQTQPIERRFSSTVYSNFHDFIAKRVTLLIQISTQLAGTALRVTKKANRP